MGVFRKSSQHAPLGYFAWEAVCLRWLAAANSVQVVRVLHVGMNELALEALTPQRATADHALAFGSSLAQLHDAGARAFGAAPHEWAGDGWLGPAEEILELSCDHFDSWGRYYVQSCLRPVADLAERRGRLDPADRWAIEAVCDRLMQGDFDDDDPPARLHGDLWSGNIVWTCDGAVLIDPAAHGGHRETDLAMLQLFGAPHLDMIIAGYQIRHPLKPGWQQRVGLHQLHPLLVHAAIYGGSYGAQAGQAATVYL